MFGHPDRNPSPKPNFGPFDPGRQPGAPELTSAGGITDAMSAQAAAESTQPPIIASWDDGVAETATPEPAATSLEPASSADREVIPAKTPPTAGGEIVPVRHRGEKNWVGRSFKGLSPAMLQAFEESTENIRVQERTTFPLGIEITPERVQEVRDMESALIAYAQSFGVDISNRVSPK